MDKTFRFGIVAAQPTDAQAWQSTARRAEERGYDILLTPDNVTGLSPVPALAAAAMATTTLRLGTYVLAAPYRPAAQVAWDAAALDLLSRGRFELGVGAGRPAAADEAATLGRVFGDFGDRVAQVTATIDAALERVPGLRVLVAGSGPRLLSAVLARADTIALGLGPDKDEAALADAVRLVRGLAGSRADKIELNVNLLAVGDETPPWLRRVVGADLSELAAHGSAAVLTGSRDQMVDRLRRRRDELGISYVVTNAAFLEALAPVVEQLAGT
jgi:probable F420-dependent oxidoreductase